MVARSLLAVLAALFLAGPASAGRIWLDPNARVPDGEPLVVTIEGLAQGQRAALSIQESCGGGRPQRSTPCPALWGPVETEAQGGTPGLRHAIAAASLAGLPRDRVLWVVVEARGWARPVSSRFHRADPCTTLATLVQTFAGGSCDLALPQVLSRLTRGADGLGQATFEVRRLAVDGGTPVTVPGTRGATGVAWLDEGKLAVTSAGGLAAVDLATGTAETLWQPVPGGLPLAAPLRLPGSALRIAFVQQSPGPQKLGDTEPSAELVLWPGERRISLPYKVHQLLAGDRQGTRLLALSLGLDDAAPLLFEIDLEQSETAALGFDNRLYQALLREPRPGSTRAAVAFEEVRGGRWRIGLAEGAAYKGDLTAAADRHALAPAWRPGGGEIAYLAEVEPPKPVADPPLPPAAPGEEGGSGAVTAPPSSQPESPPARSGRAAG